MRTEFEFNRALTQFGLTSTDLMREGGFAPAWKKIQTVLSKRRGEISVVDAYKVLSENKEAFERYLFPPDPKAHTTPKPAAAPEAPPKKIIIDDPKKNALYQWYANFFETMHDKKMNDEEAGGDLEYQEKYNELERRLRPNKPTPMQVLDATAPLGMARGDGRGRLHAMLSFIAGSSLKASSYNVEFNGNSGYVITPETSEARLYLNDVIQSVHDDYLIKLKENSNCYTVPKQIIEQQLNPTPKNDADVVTACIKIKLGVLNTSELYTSYDPIKEVYSIWIDKSLGTTYTLPWIAQHATTGATAIAAAASPPPPPPTAAATASAPKPEASAAPNPTGPAHPAAASASSGSAKPPTPAAAPSTEAQPLPYILKNPMGNNKVINVVRYHDERGPGFKINGTNCMGEPRSIICYDSGVTVSGFDKSPNLGIVGKIMLHAKDAIFKHFNVSIGLSKSSVHAAKGDEPKPPSSSPTP